MKMVMTPENMGYENAEEDTEIDTMIIIDVKMSDFNKEFTIDLPEEANNAMDLSNLDSISNKKTKQDKGLSPITGNAIGEVFN